MRHITFCFVIICVLSICAAAQTTEFTYQGSLSIGSPPAPTTGNYDFEFRLFSVDTGGSAIGTLQRLNVAVSNGVFSVKLDFGAQFPGAARYLEIGVRTAGGGSFQTLLPRNQISNAPYSVRSLNSASADTASQLSGIPASGFIQNTTSQQPASNFNISGNGAIGGNLGVGTTAPAAKLDVSGTGVVRARINSDSNAGVGLTLNNQPGWSVATVTGGQFQIFNDMIGQNAVWITPATNNVGIGSATPAAKLEVNGYTNQGTDAPSIRLKKLTGTTAPTEGNIVTISTGLDPDKILSITMVVGVGGPPPVAWIGPNYTNANGYHYSWFLSGGEITVGNATGGSAQILSKPIKILITYEQ